MHTSDCDCSFRGGQLQGARDNSATKKTNRCGRRNGSLTIHFLYLSHGFCWYSPQSFRRLAAGPESVHSNMRYEWSLLPGVASMRKVNMHLEVMCLRPRAGTWSKGNHIAKMSVCSGKGGWAKRSHVWPMLMVCFFSLERLLFILILSWLCNVEAKSGTGPKWFLYNNQSTTGP